MKAAPAKSEPARSPAEAPATRADSGPFSLPDQRPATAVQRQLQADIAGSPRQQAGTPLQHAADGSPQAAVTFAPVQRQANRTGLPDQLKAGVESLSGHSLDDVQVHYNSAQPGQLQAHAYAQGTDIHLAPGQEKHLPHEAWHVVQQKQGRVKPTMQLKAVGVNDDAGLEREADVMGRQALGTPSFAAPVQRQVRRSVGAAPVQLVKNKAARSGLDARMDGLKAKAAALLAQLMAAGQDWERTYAAKGKEKGSGILDGEKTDRVAEARNALLKEGWKQLTPQEKVELVAEATKLAGRGIGATLRGVRELVGGLPESERQEPEKTKPKPPPREEEESGSWLNELTREDLAAMQEAYSLLRKGQKKYNQAKDAVRRKGGELGETVGRQAGKLRDEFDFERRLEALRPEFHLAREQFGRLELDIEANEDRGRYASELDALGVALMNIVHGPAMAYAGEGLNEDGRKKFPQVCARALQALRESSRTKELAEQASSFFSRVAKAGTSLLDGGAREREELATAQRELAAELTRVVNKSWKKHTYVRSTPATVKAIKDALPKQASEVEKLRTAVQLATAASKANSSNRSEQTRLFYSALAGLNVDNLGSLRGAQSALEGIGGKLD